MYLAVSTTLPVSADVVWKAVKRTETLRQVTRGVLAFDVIGDWPEEWCPGCCVGTRLRLFHFFPLWRHQIVVAQVDEGQRVIRSDERGGPIAVWRHEIRVRENPSGMSHYSDEIEIQAGLVTPIVWLFACGFYRYRQWRWRTIRGK